MTANALGYRLERRGPEPDLEILEGLRSVPVPVIGDCMGRIVGTSRLRPYHQVLSSPRMCGPALTVRVRPGDNLMLHKAILIARPGDVIVVDGAGDINQALVGGLMRATAIARRLGGFVIDGALRDVADWANDGMPIFAAGNSLRGPSKDGPGEINVVIACAGLSVSPGDLIVGDADGVINVAPSEGPALLTRCRNKVLQEEATLAANTAGHVDEDRIDALLRERGAQF